MYSTAYPPYQATNIQKKSESAFFSILMVSLNTAQYRPIQVFHREG